MMWFYQKNAAAVGLITINRPDALNAVDADVMEGHNLDHQSV